MIRVVSLLGNYRSIDKNKQVCGQNENFNAKKIIILKDTGHFWMHLLPMNNEYHSLDIIFQSCFWILVNLP